MQIAGFKMTVQKPMEDIMVPLSTDGTFLWLLHNFLSRGNYCSFHSKWFYQAKTTQYTQISLKYFT